MTQATIDHPFLTQRLREWSLFRAVTLELPWPPDDLLASSNWLQLKTAATTNTEANKILAEAGRVRHKLRDGQDRVTDDVAGQAQILEAASQNRAGFAGRIDGVVGPAVHEVESGGWRACHRAADLLWVTSVAVSRGCGTGAGVRQVRRWEAYGRRRKPPWLGRAGPGGSWLKHQPRAGRESRAQRWLPVPLMLMGVYERKGPANDTALQ